MALLALARKRVRHTLPTTFKEALREFIGVSHSLFIENSLEIFFTSDSNTVLITGNGYNSIILCTNTKKLLYGIFNMHRFH